MNTEELKDILAAVNVGRLVNIVRWQIDYALVGPSVAHAAATAGGEWGWIVTCVFVRPDRDTKRIEEGAGRGWYVPRNATPLQVQRTAFSAVKMLVDHELLEFFTVDGERLFDPHDRNTAHGESLPKMEPPMLQSSAAETTDKTIAAGGIVVAVGVDERGLSVENMHRKGSGWQGGNAVTVDHWTTHGKVRITAQKIS